MRIHYLVYTQEESGETFQLKKNVVSAAAKESRQKA
jgi:hypothetical protein